MSKLKIIAIIAIVFVALCSVISFLGVRINNLQDEISVYDNNFKAINLENSKLQDGIIAYKLDIEQLEYVNDSIIEDLNTLRRELQIKDKELKQLQNIKTEVHIKDSILIRDTIFKPSFIRLDTVLTNKWYKTQVILEYPDKIRLNMMYKSDISVIASTKKEIIGTPKKCWLGRVFQKKHNVIRVDVTDANPYSEIKESKFIIIE